MQISLSTTFGVKYRKQPDGSLGYEVGENLGRGGVVEKAIRLVQLSRHVSCTDKCCFSSSWVTVAYFLPRALTICTRFFTTYGCFGFSQSSLIDDFWAECTSSCWQSSPCWRPVRQIHNPNRLFGSKLASSLVHSCSQKKLKAHVSQPAWSRHRFEQSLIALAVAADFLHVPLELSSLSKFSQLRVASISQPHIWHNNWEGINDGIPKIPQTKHK